jgi:hypothetical protein
MATATITAPRFPADTKNGKHPWPDDVSQVSDWYAAQGVVDDETFASLHKHLANKGNHGMSVLVEVLGLRMAAETAARIAAEQAAKAKTVGRSFKVNHTDKGVLTWTLPGMGQTVWMTVEGFQAFVETDNLRASLEYVQEHGDAIIALRAKHKQSPEYAATVAGMAAEREAYKAKKPS